MSEDSDDEMDRAERISNRRTSRRSEERGRTEWSMDSDSNDQSETSNTDGASDSNDQSETSNTDGASGPNDQSETSETSGTSDSSAVRDQKHVAMYLEESLAEDLDLRFDELQLAYRKEHGEKMTKNGEFYPALARAAIKDTRVTEELGLEAE